nr:ribonuclease H-like domain-containing protein [Tanacetum cinerariifolium]
MAFPLPVIEFPLPEEVPTGSGESSHCQKKRDATAVKIALLLKPRRNCQSKSYDSFAKYSYEVPASAATTGTTSDGTGKKKGRTVTVTADDIQKRKNDVKARTTLLLSLPDEHQLRFNKYKTAQELWAAILKTFGGNEATKKTKKNLLKQQYGNFKAEGSETLEQTFNRLQVIISQMQFMDVKIKHDDLDQKRNEEVNTTSVSNASTNVPTASANIGVVTISQDTTCAYIASQSSGSQIKFEDINQIDEDDMEEMDIKWNMAPSLPPNVFRIAAHSSCAVLYLLNRNWCSSGRDSSKVVLAFTSFFLFCMSSAVTVTVLPFFLPVPSLVVPVVAALAGTS